MTFHLQDCPRQTVVVDSDQLVDVFNILAGVGTIKMVARHFKNHDLVSSYSVRPKNTPSGRVEIEKFARDKVIESVQGHDFNYCASLLAKQHAQNFDEGLEVLLGNMQLDAGAARALASRKRYAGICKARYDRQIRFWTCSIRAEHLNFVESVK